MDGPAATARMNGRTTRLFPQGPGRMGLMPVPVLEKPGAYAVDILDGAGRVLHTANVTVRDARFRRQNIVLGKAAAELKPAPGEMDTVRAFRQTVTESRIWSEPFQVPVPGCMTSPFGVLRLHNGKLTGAYHGGVDQRGAAGVPVRAVSSGIAKLVRMFNIHGGTIGIDHGWGLTSIYLHLSKFAVPEGTPVKAGDIIGYVGSTGRSTAPHLHWGISVNGIAVNPTQWVKLAPCTAPKK